jgi:hypothetical protein
LVASNCGAMPSVLLAACRADLDVFRGRTAIRDDLTLMAVSRAT